MTGVKTTIINHVKDISQDQLQISTSIAILCFISLLSELGISLPATVVISLAGVAVYTAVETIVFRIIKQMAREPWPKVASVVLALLITIVTALIPIEAEAVILLIITALFYVASGIKSQILEEDNPIYKWRDGERVDAVMAFISYIMGVAIIIIGVFISLIAFSIAIEIFHNSNSLFG